ncbi:MAG: glycoside hydrolase family 3 N-terminal domain-containing protein [Thermoleophilia bacterium]
MLANIVAAILSLHAAEQPPSAPAPALTLRQAVGQHMVFAYSGLEPPAALRRRIARGEAAGVILFSRNVRSAAQVRATIRRLQAIARPPGLRAPLIVMTDQEGGPVRRIPGAPRRAAARVRTAAQARADGARAARNLRRAGVNLNLAPVADVGRPRSALTRERRTYGGSPQDVARRAGAFVTGLEAGGVLGTAKHFPGFGAARRNTDNAPQRIGLSMKTLRSVDLPPFAELVDGGIDAVMLSTAVYPALDARPAAFSPRWVRGELRRRLGFRGVTISDDLGTPAVAAFGSNARRAVLAVDAGIDLPLFAAGYRAGAQAAGGLLSAARRGTLDPLVLRDKARRVLALRAKLSPAG